MTATRPLPNFDDPLYAPQYAALRDKRIVVQHCTRCGHKQWPPRERCFACHAGDLGWTDVPQRGEIYTYMVAFRAFNPWFADKIPYGLVVADLGEGIRIMAPYPDTDVAELDCGIAVQASFERHGDHTFLQWERA